MNWRIFSRIFGAFLLVALAFVVLVGVPFAKALRSSWSVGASWSVAMAPGCAFGVLLGIGTANALRDGVFPGAVALPWPPLEWKELEVDDARRQLLRASAWVLTITGVTLVAPITYALTASALPTLAVVATYVLFAIGGIHNTYTRAPEIIAKLREISRSGPPTLAWEPGRVLALRYPLPWRILFTLFGIPPIAVGVAGLLGVLPGYESRTHAIFFSVVFLAFGWYCGLATNFISVVVDETGIVYRSPWRRRRTIPWSQVRGHSRSEFNQTLTIHTEQGRVTVSDYLSGSSELGQRLWQRVLK